MKSKKIIINDLKEPDLWLDLIHELKFESFKNQHPKLNIDNEEDEEELGELFYSEVVSKIFSYGEIANLELIIDENLNIIGGKIIPCNR